MPKVLVGLVFGFVLHIEHGWQVAILQVYGLDEVIGLLLGGAVNTVEVIGSTGKPILAGLEEVVAEVAVGLGGSLGGLDHHKAYGAMVYLAVVLQLFPVDTPLMVRDVDAMNLVALGIAHVAIQRAPAESERTYKEIIEEVEIDSDYSCSAYPVCPTGHVAQNTDKESGLTTATGAMVSVGSAYPFSTDYASLIQFRI